MTRAATICNFLIGLMCVLPRAAHSQDCVAESAALNANADITAANSAFQSEATDALQDFTSFCSIIRRSCVKDLSEINSTPQLREACTSNNGQVVTRDVRLDCTGSISGIPILGGFSVGATQFPACVGASCDPDSLPDSVETVISTVTEEARSQIESALGDDAECTVFSSGWATHISAPLLLLTVVLSWIDML